MAELAPDWISPEEYLRREALSETRNEYFDGQIFAMAGTSKEHSRIAVNLIVMLGSALRGTSCEAFESNIRVRVDETGLYTYPDVIVACDPMFDEDGLDTLLNPVIVIEILSPSTEDYDTGPKFAHYRRLPSVREVWFVAQEQVWIERNRRIGPEQWLREWHREGEMRIEEPSLTLPMAEVYERVKLDANPPLR